MSLRKQLASFKNYKLLFAQLTSVILLAGHSTLYAYLTPFVKTTLGLGGTWISIIYLIFGISALSGGAIGGTLADRFGEKPTILSIIAIFSVTIFLRSIHDICFTHFLNRYGYMGDDELGNHPADAKLPHGCFTRNIKYSNQL